MFRVANHNGRKPELQQWTKVAKRCGAKSPRLLSAGAGPPLQHHEDDDVSSISVGPVTVQPKACPPPQGAEQGAHLAHSSRHKASPHSSSSGSYPSSPPQPQQPQHQLIIPDTHTVLSGREYHVTFQPSPPSMTARSHTRPATKQRPVSSPSVRRSNPISRPQSGSPTTGPPIHNQARPSYWSAAPICKPTPPHPNRPNSSPPGRSPNASPDSGSSNLTFEQAKAAARSLRRRAWERTEDDLDCLDRLLGRTQFFVKLPSERRRTLYKVLTRKYCEAGESLMGQGDAADSFYLLTEGAMSVFRRNDCSEEKEKISAATVSGMSKLERMRTQRRLANNDSSVTTSRLESLFGPMLATLPVGSGVGQDALQKPGTTRNATVICMEPCVFVCLKDVDFWNVMNISPLLSSEEAVFELIGQPLQELDSLDINVLDRWLKKNAFLASLPRKVRLACCAKSHVHDVAENSKVCVQGQQGKTFHIIIEGSCSVHIAPAHSKLRLPPEARNKANVRRVKRAALMAASKATEASLWAKKKATKKKVVGYVSTAANEGRKRLSYRMFEWMMRMKYTPVKVYSMLDVNNKASLNAIDFKAILDDKMGISYTPDALEEFGKCLDIDGNGKVSRNEFKEVMRMEKRIHENRTPDDEAGDNDTWSEDELEEIQSYDLADLNEDTISNLYGPCVAVMTQGLAFGELALSSEGQLRQATVIARESCRMMTMSKLTFDVVLDQHAQLSGKSMSHDTTKFILEKIPQDREESELAMLERITRHIRFFGQLPAEVHKQLCSCLQVMTVDVNEPIIAQGDSCDEDGKFYIILEGSVAVYAKFKTPGRDDEMDHPEHGRFLTALAAGDSFGERAMTSDNSRAATCVSRDPCTLMWIDKANYKRTLGSLMPGSINFMPETTRKALSKMNTIMSVGERQRELEKAVSFLKTVGFFKQLDKKELEAVAVRIKYASFPGEKLLCAAGETNDLMYVIVSGSVSAHAPVDKAEDKNTPHAHHGDGHERQRELNSMGKCVKVYFTGDAFGYVFTDADLHQKHVCSLMTRENTELITLSREDFLQTLAKFSKKLSFVNDEENALSRRSNAELSYMQNMLAQTSYWSKLHSRPELRQKMLHVVEKETLKKGEVLMFQNDVHRNMKMYLLLSGNLDVRIHAVDNPLTIQGKAAAMNKQNAIDALADLEERKQERHKQIEEGVQIQSVAPELAYVERIGLMQIDHSGDEVPDEDDPDEVLHIEPDSLLGMKVATFRGDGKIPPIGEISLINGSARTATIIASSNCELISISQENFDLIGLREIEVAAQNVQVAFLRSISIFQPMPQQKLIQFFRFLTKSEFARGTQIIKADRETENLYIIRNGECVVSQPAAAHRQTPESSDAQLASASKRKLLRRTSTVMLSSNQMKLAPEEICTLSAGQTFGDFGLGTLPPGPKAHEYFDHLKKMNSKGKKARLRPDAVVPHAIQPYTVTAATDVEVYKVSILMIIHHTSRAVLDAMVAAARDKVDRWGDRTNEKTFAFVSHGKKHERKASPEKQSSPAVPALPESTRPLSPEALREGRSKNPSPEKAQTERKKSPVSPKAASIGLKTVRGGAPGLSPSMHSPSSLARGRPKTAGTVSQTMNRLRKRPFTPILARRTGESPHF